VLSGLVKTIPEEKMDLRRGDGFWTVAEHVSHLAQVQPMLLGRLQRFMNEARPEFVPFIPDASGQEPDIPQPVATGSALQQFSEVREQQLSLLAGADDTIWQRKATHPEYAHYSLYILARHILMHDYWHMYRMEELWLTRDAYLTRLE
jgi:uncharacterized damage-inducible protein DinB